MIRKLLAFLGVVFFLVLLGASYQIFVWVTLPHKTQAESQIFQVIKGQSTDQIALALEQKDLIHNALFFKFYSQATRQGRKIKAGEYRLSATMKIPEILDILTLGKSISYPVTFPEGINIYEMAEILENKNIVQKDKFLKACKDQALIQRLLGQKLLSLEGYLFPETYHFEKNTQVQIVIETMVKRFLKVYREVMSEENAKTSLSQHDVVLLASIVEKETSIDYERPHIASVFFNRLNKKMRLQSDPTIIYGILVQTGQLIKNIKKKHITTYNPYNTYTIHGLPLEPIANPGQQSIHAVIFPKQTDDLYFVSRNDGTHYFSKTYDEHKKAVRKYQIRGINKK